MTVVFRNGLLFLLIPALLLPGCKVPPNLQCWRAPVEPPNTSIAPFIDLAHRQAIQPTPLATGAVQQPATLEDLQTAPRWNMTIDEAIHLALSSDYVLRSLGGQIVSQPDSARTSIDTALVQTNARAGEQAALSAFDAQLRSSLTFTRADRGLKRQILLSNATAIDSLFANLDTVVEKRNRLGTVFGFRTTLDYDRDNLGIPPNRFASAYDQSVGLEMRHPLARGGGREYNEIAGPGAQPGEYRGIVIAQINTNIAVHDFRVALRDHLHDVIRTYWGLYLSYADLDSRKETLDIARETLRIAKEKQAEGLFDADQVYIAEERFYAAEAAYLDSVSGAPSRSILGILGVSGSQLAGVDIGVLALERRLRFQLGLPPSDGRLIRPSNVPSPAKIVFDWDDAVATAVVRRPELMRQSHVVHKKRMELKAAKNFLLPRLDAIAQYRFRGFGDNYTRDGLQDDGALSELFNGDLQEWVAGVQYEWPAGNRIGHETVRNARLSLARELGVLEQQQHQISHELASAFTEVERAFKVRDTARSRLDAARRHEQAAVEKFSTGLPIEIETVLEAQRLAAEARAGFDAAEVDCEIAILKVNVAKATFLNQVAVSIQSYDEPVAVPVPTTPIVRSAAPTNVSTKAGNVPPHQIPETWPQTAPSNAVSQDPFSTQPAAPTHPTLRTPSKARLQGPIQTSTEQSSGPALRQPTIQAQPSNFRSNSSTQSLPQMPAPVLKSAKTLPAKSRPPAQPVTQQLQVRQIGPLPMLPAQANIQPPATSPARTLPPLPSADPSQPSWFAPNPKANLDSGYDQPSSWSAPSHSAGGSSDYSGPSQW